LDLAFGILEKGVAGVVIHAQSPQELRAILSRARTTIEEETLHVAAIERIQPSGMGDRVCVDTCSLMQEGEGLLVGNSSGFLFLVQAEAKANPYVAPRPFRVNAGPVHAYVRVKGGRTRYLSELEAGDTVSIFNFRGNAREATVGRIKIERRPILLIEAVCNSVKGSILLQNAETIRLSAPDGKALSIVDLKPGDSVLVSIENTGRHFGMKIDETIQEK
jgi:3-dehydroquinate synthase II